MRVTVTWNHEGEQHIETVQLVGEYDELFAGNVPVTRLTDLDLGDMVMFEDEQGLFGLEASQIVSITPAQDI